MLTKQVLIEPKLFPELTAIIMNLCLELQDLPENQKLTVVTGLPKKEGAAGSTASLRPISVGPVLGRLINKVIADRIGETLYELDILSSAQTAVLSKTC